MNKPRLLLAAVVAIALGLPASPAAATTEQPTRPGGVALTWAPTYMSSDHDYSASEAVALAKSFDLVAAMPSAFAGDAAAMRQANPRLTLLAYSNATFLDGSTSGVPESEFAHDTSGRRIRSTNFDNYLMEPSNTGWATRASATCRSRAVSAGYDGCLMDMLTMGIFSRNYVTSLPARPGGAQYTESQWRDELIALVHELRADDPTQVMIGNAVSNSSRYWREAVTSRPIVMSLPGAQMEDFLRGSADSATSFPSTSSWLDAVNVIKDMDSQGVTGLFSTKLWSSASQAQVAQWEKYSMATFLMGAKGNSYWAFTRSRDKAGATGANLPYRMPKEIGLPTSAMYGAGEGYVRDFDHGRSVVNPTAGTVTLNLGGSYRRLDGSTVSSVTLPAHSGEVLVDSGTPAGSPVTASASTLTATQMVATSGSGTTASGSAPTGSITSPRSGTLTAGSVQFAGKAAGNGIRRVKLAVLNRGTGRWLQPDGTWGRYATRTATFTGYNSVQWQETLRLPRGSYWVGLIVTDSHGVQNPSPRAGVALVMS